MVALVLSLALAFAVGLSSWLPRALGTDIGIDSVEPSRLVVEPDAVGTATLGDGYTVALTASGFRYAKDDVTMAETVTAGAPVLALRGPVVSSGAPREQTRSALGRVTVSTLVVSRVGALWTGVVEGDGPEGGGTLPFTWRVVRTDTGVLTTVTVDGADGLVLPLDWRPAVTGRPPALPAQNLRRKAWWLARDAPAEAAFTWVLGTTVGIGPATAARGVDLTVDGRVDVHVWSGTAELLLTGAPRTARG